MRIHDWIFGIVDDICFDREYVYPCFVRHFSSFMSEVMEQGMLSGSGVHVIPGIKSNISAKLTWRLEHRLDWVKSNEIHLTCEFEGDAWGWQPKSASFEMSSGAKLE